MLSGCGARSLETPESLDLAVVDSAVPPVSVDLAPRPADLSDVDFGPKRHLGEPCDFDAECLSGDCLTASESRGEFDNVCGQICGDITGGTYAPCVEGLCVSFDLDVYYCLQPCDAPNHNAECKNGFVCCSGGAGVQSCVSPAALGCVPK